MKSRPKSCTRHGIVPDIKKKHKLPLTTNLSYFTLLDENQIDEHYLLEPKSANSRTLQ